MKTSIRSDVLDWLLQGDPSVRWQVKRDLLEERPADFEVERNRIEREGWGACILEHQDDRGVFGGGLYSPKWISTTYSMLLLRRLGLSPVCERAKIACRLLLERGFYKDGGINFFASMDYSEQCVTGMVLMLCAYFQIEDERVIDLVHFLLKQQMADDGWNCEAPKGAHHSSFHTTITVLEGLFEFEQRLPDRDIRDAQNRAVEFLLKHRLYRSDHTGEIINPQFTRLSFPPRWHYDILRALDYFQCSGVDYDPRMDDALEILAKKEKKGRWPLQQKYPGRVYFDLETVGQPCRMNTLRALRVLKMYGAE